MRVNTVLAAVLALLGAVPPSARAEEAKRASKVKVAVLEVRAVGTLDPKTFEGVASLEATVLGEARADLQVVNAADIRTMIGFEREKQLLGCTESGCMAEIGGALGVDYILSTESNVVGGKWLLNLSLLDVVKSTPFKRVSKITEDPKKIVDLCVESVRELAGAIPRKDGTVPAVEPAPAEKPEPSAQPVATATAPAVSRTVSIALLAVGAVVTGAGAGCLGYSYTIRNEYEDGLRLGTLTRAQLQAKASNGKSLGIAGVVGISVGAAALVAGVVTLLVPGSSPAPVGFAPVPGGAQAVVTLPLP